MFYFRAGDTDFVARYSLLQTYRRLFVALWPIFGQLYEIPVEHYVLTSYSFTIMLEKFLLTVAALTLTAPAVFPCTRVVYIGDDNTVITGRTLDWKEDIATNLYVMPRGIVRSGYGDADSTLTWTSQYGSVVAVGYDLGVTEGMNEAGLVCNLLYMPGTSYSRPGGDRRPYMSASLWAQYVLDNFATTGDAVTALAQDAFQVHAPSMPGGDSTTLHMAISDATGNSAVIEYIDGDIRIHVGKEYKVLTNAPAYDRQLAVAEYWKNVGGLNMLPGTNRSADRFARASFYIDAVPTNTTHAMALAGVFGVLFNCSVPVGISVPDQPEISSTRWRSVADQKNKVYYYATTLNPSVMWIDLNDFSLEPGAPVMKLDIIRQKKAYMGNVVHDMERSKGFTPMF